MPGASDQPSLNLLDLDCFLGRKQTREYRAFFLFCLFVFFFFDSDVSWVTEEVPPHRNRL